MARKASSRTGAKRRRSKSEIALYVLSLIIILSMTIGFVLSLLPSTSGRGSVPANTPTSTPQPTVTPTPGTTEPSAAPQATPQPSP
jgi:hypothetical protein